MGTIYRYRDGFAAGPALFLLAVPQVLVVRAQYKPDAEAQAPIEIVMLAPSPEPAPPPKPISLPKTIPQAVAPPTPAVVPARPEHPPEAESPVVPVVVPAIAAAPETKPAPAALVEPPTREAPPRIASAADLEAGYVAGIRRMLNAIKRYPTGREASLMRPSGTVRVWLLLDRQGRLMDKGVETSSGSLLLDNTALRTVATGSYPPYPDRLWPDRSQHRFHADIDFIVNQTN